MSAPTLDTHPLPPGHLALILCVIHEQRRLPAIVVRLKSHGFRAGVYVLHVGDPCIVLSPDGLQYY